LRSHTFQHRTVADAHAARIRKRNDPTRPQGAQGAAQSLDRHGQVVGNVIAGHGQIHGLIRLGTPAASGHFQEEGTDLLQGAATTENEGSSLEAVDRGERGMAQQSRYLGIGVRQLLGIVPAVTGNAGTRNNDLNTKWISAQSAETEKISWQ